MSGGTVESVWIPSYSTGVRFNALPRKSHGNTPELRPVASVRHPSPTSAVSRTSKRRITAERDYIAAASAGLSFDDDVIRERCFQVVPFNSQELKILRNQTRRSSSVRHRNDISYLNKAVDPISYLKPVKPAKSSYERSDPVARSGHAIVRKPVDVQKHDYVKDDLSFQRIKSSNGIDGEPLGEQASDAALDECLLMKLSPNTARWLAENTAVTDDSQDTRDRLHQALDTFHGPSVTDKHAKLIEDSDSDSDSAATEKAVKKPWLSEKQV